MKHGSHLLVAMFHEYVPTLDWKQFCYDDEAPSPATQTSLINTQIEYVSSSKLGTGWHTVPTALVAQVYAVHVVLLIVPFFVEVNLHYAGLSEHAN